jgi:hypothetical protein
MKIQEALKQALNNNTDEDKVLYDFYLSELSEILEAKSLLSAKEAEVRAKLEKYGKTINVAVPEKTPKSTPYPFTGSWRDKIDFVLKGSDPLTGKEILAFIETKQPELKGKITSSIYPTLSDNSKDGKRYIKIYDEVLKVNKFSLRN